MTQRGRTSMSSAHSIRSCDSSPDPLALSTNENNARPMRRATSREPLLAASPSKQNRRLNVSEMSIASPAKSIIMNTPRMGSASPWRIKVTVQAEPESNGEDSPTIQRFTRTQTTTVPLKDHDVQTPAKRGRGRPRKSDVGTATKPKRKGTPVKKVSRSGSRDASLGPAEPSAADVDSDAPPKRRRGRPRKIVQPPPGENEAPAEQELDTQAETQSDEFSLSSHQSSNAGSRRISRVATPNTEDPILDVSDESPRFFTRRGTPHTRKTIQVSDSSDDAADVTSRASTPASEDDLEGIDQVEQQALTHVEHADLRTPLESSVETMSVETNNLRYSLEDDMVEVLPGEDIEDEESPEGHDLTGFAFDEGATRMPDDTTVLDSENFSMISVDSLPSCGGSSSPPKPEETQEPAARSIDSILDVEYLQPNANVMDALKSRAFKSPAQPSSQHGHSDAPSSLKRPLLSRYKTPIVDNEVPSIPPAIEIASAPAQKTETPKIGRVVTAGVALQGALEPARVTPDNIRREGMDDLFRGFSEGTRKELQAGLRLGEQLAEGQPVDPPRLPASSSLKSQPDSAPKQDQDDYVVPVTEPIVATEVQYPALNVEPAENSLLSPARSEDEMSWQVDTPPVIVTRSTGASDAQTRDGQERVGQQCKATTECQSGHATVQDDYADIWQEEASRTSNSPHSGEEIAKNPTESEDIFVADDMVQPARGKLPRTWRRKASNHFQYSDEAESPQLSCQPDTVEDHVIENLRHEETEDDVSDASEASDDTGMFFQSNMPKFFDNKRDSDRKQRKADQHSLSSLLDQGESLIPDSSPPVLSKNTPAAKTNPFIATPPRFPGFPCSPTKSSPLRRELRGSDISSDSPRRIEDESTLPILQSSPFHTFVDGQSKFSVASDQQQFRYEMEGSTSASVRQVRHEADEYLDAYEPQERTLNEITEVTEPSRTWFPVNVAPSSPPRRQTFAQHMQSPTRKPVPLFSTATRPGKTHDEDLAENVDQTEDDTTDESLLNEHTPPSSTTTSQPPITMGKDQPDIGLLSRVTATVNAVVSRQTNSTTSPHPILSRLTPLPKVEPWTKTHYKALDKLYTTHLKHSALFSPSVTSPTPLSITNTRLLQKFLTANPHPYVGATFSAWGYSMQMTEELVVLCAVYMENLSLASVAEYEERTGRQIQMGECVPGRTGDAIKGDDVLKRLATVVLGESVRRDEKAGKKIDRRRGLEIIWP
ncbi:hypothetical protein ACN47E_002060 [Coniothyrium glycines]